MMHAHHAFAFGSYAVSLSLALTAVVYLRGLRQARTNHSNVIPSWFAVSFVLGLLLVWVAVDSRVAVLDHESLTAHMVQHLLLMTLAPLLIWLGAPLRPLLDGLPERVNQVVIRPLSRSASVQQFGKALAHPAVCWLGAAVTLVGWHVPSVFRLGLQSEIWHGIEQASFLATGLLFWWPVVQSLQSVSYVREWTMLLYLFLATLPCDILSGFLVFCDRVVYPVYLNSPQPFGLSPLEDQQCAGALMWTCVTVVYLIAGTVLTARLLSPQRSRDYWILRSEPQDNAGSPAVQQTVEAI
jgi:putative membrane protein